MSLGIAPKPYGYWRIDDRKNMRLEFENAAKAMNFDPLVAKNWYSITKTMFENNKVDDSLGLQLFNYLLQGIQTVTGFYGGSMIKALMDLLPEIGLEEHKFRFLRRMHTLCGFKSS